MKTTLFCIYLLLFAYISSYGQHSPIHNADPKKVQLITADIPRFWAAFDSCKTSPQNSVAIYNRLYFAKGSPGLTSFKTAAIFTTENLVTVTEKDKLYYESIRFNTLQIESLKQQIYSYLQTFKLIYPQAKFPDVYFLIGDMNAGGKSEKDGLLIGAEVNCADSTSDFTNIYPPFIKVLKRLTIKNIPITVIHELVHYQQSYVDSATDLLGYAIKEGCADFIAKLVTGRNNNELAFKYGEEHEKQLWKEFKPDLHSDDINKWFYNSGTDEVPSNLGYYIGYKITEAYYNRSPDKIKAISEILNIKDFDLILNKSGYDKKFR